MEKEVVRRLKALADPVAARRARTYFKKADEVTLLGVKTPAVRALTQDVAREVRGGWKAADAIFFCDRMTSRHDHEAKIVGVLVLGRYRAGYPRSLLRLAKGWVASGRFGNWAAIDALCPEVLTPLVQQYPDLAPQVASWARARSLWLRRAAAVTFVPLARRGDHIATAYEIAETLRSEREDLVQKAAGWLLRECGRTDPERLECFLLEIGAGMPRTTVRYAIERYPAARRRRLLRATRG